VIRISSRRLLLASLASALLVLHTGSASACSCIPPEFYIDPPKSEIESIFKNGHFRIFHGLVVARNDGKLEVNVLKSFRGGPMSRLTVNSGPTSLCGTTLVEGEELVFRLYDSRLSLCGKLPATPQLLDAMDRHSKVFGTGQAAPNLAKTDLNQNVIRVTIISKNNPVDQSPTRSIAHQKAN
jgi:hypothetical protein